MLLQAVIEMVGLLVVGGLALGGIVAGAFLIADRDENKEEK